MTADTVLYNCFHDHEDEEFPSLSLSMKLPVNISFKIGEGTAASSLGVFLDAEYASRHTEDPRTDFSEMTLLISTFGQNETLSTATYSVENEDGKMDTYTYTSSASEEEGYWTYELEDPVEDSLSYEDEELEQMLDFTALFNTINFTEAIEAEELLADEELAQIMEQLKGISLYAEFYIDTVSFLPVGFHLDSESNDLSRLSQLLTPFLVTELGENAEGSTPAMELVINELSFDCAFSFEPVDPITIPEEALASKSFS